MENSCKIAPEKNEAVQLSAVSILSSGVRTGTERLALAVVVECVE